MNSRSPRYHGFLWALFLALALVIAAPAPSVAADDALVVETESGEHRFTVEIADDDASRSRGLMYRQSLAPDHGMLFLYDSDREIGMWMRNTYIPLDMVFIRADGTVHRVVKNTTPFSTETISSRGPVRYVLEIAAGQAERIGLRRGDTVRHAHIGDD